ncbi:hypothetical protein DPMN_149593 [Dreissena polymorpha]|uniref:Uncharacterized protein n=1 Tax=Dreissena polymorpha TaxID=45954 RepID=A0A9D4FBM5_DREPO|nr:hypothetical protein DPMN_149593 [Dreissena polymorpha]
MGTLPNADVLAFVRLKQPSAVERAWYFEGKIFAVFKGNKHATQIQRTRIQKLAGKVVAQKSYSETGENPEPG